MSLEQYQAGFRPFLFGIALALILTCFLTETGPGPRKTITIVSPSTVTNRRRIDSSREGTEVGVPKPNRTTNL